VLKTLTQVQLSAYALIVAQKAIMDGSNCIDEGIVRADLEEAIKTAAAQTAVVVFDLEQCVAMAMDAAHELSNNRYRI
jgi:hypothetical protein